MGSSLLKKLSQNYPVAYSVVEIPKLPANEFITRHLSKLDDALLRAVPKRQAEFIAGRLAASKAIEDLTGDQVWIHTKPSREPEWPSGIVGSISHTKKVAVAVAGRKSDFQGIGYDRESFKAEFSESLFDAIFTEQDRNLHRQCTINKGGFCYLLFSAKESLFKCLFPHVRFFFGFEVCYMSNLDVETSQFSLTLISDLPPFKAGEEFFGHFHFEDDAVETTIFYITQT